MSLNIVLLITRAFQICLCLASWILTFVYTPAYLYGDHIISTWFQSCGIGPLTVIWLLYIMIGPRISPRRTSALATIICDLFINALWLVFWLWPVIDSAGKDDCIPIFRYGDPYLPNPNVCVRQTDDPVVLGLAIPSWVSFIITSGLIIYSAWPLYRKGVIRQCQVRCGGMVYYPEGTGLPTTETTEKHFTVQTEQV